jgi:hypothetical protein
MDSTNNLYKGCPVIDVNVLVIGGGIAAVGLLVNAMKADTLVPLVESGLAFIETQRTFGGGIIDDYGVNSNSCSADALAPLYRMPPAPLDKDGKLPPSKFNEDSLKDCPSCFGPPSEKIVDFPELVESNVIKYCLSYKELPFPLSIYGLIYNAAGNHLLHRIYE